MYKRLITKEFADRFANYPLYSQEGEGIPNMVAIAAYRLCNIRYYVLEGNEEEGGIFTFFALVCGLCDGPELTYCNANEIASFKLDATRYGFPSGVYFRVEPIKGWKPTALKDIIDDDVVQYVARMSESSVTE